MTRKPPAIVLVLALAGLTAAGFAAALPANGVAKPKSGDLCSKSQLGKTSSNLVCSRSGTRYRWFVRKGTTATTTPAATPATPSTGPSTIEVVSLVFGTLPATNSLTMSLTCSGLAAEPASQKKDFKFGTASATDQVQFALQPPSTSNPTGSGCSAALTVAGTAPGALQVLLNGRSIAGPTNSATLSVATFTADGPLVLTVLQSAAAASGVTVPPTGSTTTVPGATTVAGTSTTIAPTGPPLSGKPEIRARLTGLVPTTVLGVDVKVTCTPAPGTTSFQTFTARIARDGLFIVPAVLNAAAGATPATSCQIEGLLAVTPAPQQVTAQVIVNGIRVSGPSIGTSINSPAFEAGQPFTSTLEFAFPPDPSASTTTLNPTATTTTTSTATTTTIVAASSNSLTLEPATGTVPANTLGYLAQITCTNVIVGGVNQPTYSFSSSFNAKGGTTVYPFTGQSTSQCQLAVSTLVSGTPATTGAVQILVNAIVVASGTASATSPSFGTAAPVQFRVRVAY